MSGRGFIGRYKYLAVLLILLFFVTTLMAVSHHHDNTEDDHGCPICIAINHQSVDGPLSIGFDGVPFLVATTDVVAEPVLTDALFFNSSSSRGPPA
jgi:hypothetical protein